MATDRQIYVACIASYNAGMLFGEWIDFDEYTDIDDLNEAIAKMLKRSPIIKVEEWRIDDYQGFGPAQVDEMSLEQIIDLNKMIVEHGDIFPYLVRHIGLLIDAKECIENGGYQGVWDSLEHWAENQLEDKLSKLPQNLKYYFDFARFGADCELDGAIFTITDEDNQLHVFSGTW